MDNAEKSWLDDIQTVMRARLSLDWASTGPRVGPHTELRSHSMAVAAAALTWSRL
jgi:hypothetical protein